MEMKHGSIKKIIKKTIQKFKSNTNRRKVKYMNYNLRKYPNVQIDIVLNYKVAININYP